MAQASPAPEASGASKAPSVPENPSAAWIWWHAIRPNTLPAAIAPVLVGFGLAIGSGVFSVGPAAACLAVALLLQIAANLANDLADFRSGADTDARMGPMRVAQRGLATPRQLMIATGITIGLAGIAGLYLVTVGGPILLAVGVAAVISALAYTGGPWPYGYHGLGEAFVFVFFGLVAVIGTSYLQLGVVRPVDVVAALPMGGLATAILVVNNYRDIATDRVAGKHTLAASFGPTFARIEYVAMLALAVAAPLWIFVTGTAGPAVLLPLLAAPLAYVLLRVVFSDGDPRRLNPVLKGTARLELAVAALLALGLASGIH